MSLGGYSQEGVGGGGQDCARIQGKLVQINGRSSHRSCTGKMHTLQDGLQVCSLSVS